ncbi:MAG: ABC transporter permease subunit [Candidatus Thalassarchaeaceae archaeon]|nr:ABC transporter permease subunit [Candidatus Thalassarchaeaceae archaeon]
MSEFGLRVSRVAEVCKKELVDFVRDWRTVLAMVLVPIMIFPVIFIALPLFLQGEAAELAEHELAIEIQLDGEIPAQLNQLLSDRNLVITAVPLVVNGTLSIPGDDVDRLQSGIEDGDLYCILRLRETDTNASISYDYAILMDSTSELSREARGRTLDGILTWEQYVINNTLDEQNLTYGEVFDPIHWDGDQDDANLASKGEQTAMGLAMFIPLVIALWTASAAIQPSIDLTAGERERGTMEALLCTPVARADLLFGKWLAVAVVASTSVLANMAGLLFAIAFLAGDVLGAPTISLTSAILLLLSVLLFAIFVVAVELAIAVRAHSVKEAGSILGPMILVFIGPTMFAQFVNLEGIEFWWFLLPIFNVTLAMRESLMGFHDPLHVALWLSSSLIYAIGAILWASKQFNREDLVESLS